MALTDLNVTENYTAYRILRQTHLNTAIANIEDYINDNINQNFQQLGLDVFGVLYEFNNDGLQSYTPSLIDRVAFLGENETVTGSWTFENTIGFSQVASFTNFINGSVQPRCLAYRVTSDQTIATATDTAISFGAEGFDLSSMHDNSTNPSRITIPSGAGGSYFFNGQVTFAANATGRREVAIFKNGTELARSIIPTAGAGYVAKLQVSAIDNASSGDYYELYVYQDSGGNLAAQFGQTKTFLSAMKAW